MKKLLPFLAVPLLAFAPFATVSSAPGVVVESTSRDLATDETWTSTMSVWDANLLIESADPRGGSSGSVVFRSENGGELIMNDDERRQYIRLDQAKIEELSDGIQAMMSQVEQMMASIPEAQREALLSRGGGIPGMEALAGGIPTIEWRNTGETDTKAGYPATRWDMFVGDRRTQEMWVTDWSNVDGEEAFRPVMAAFGTLMKSFMEAMPSGMRGDRGMSNIMDFDRGLPVVTYELDEDGNRTVETTMGAFEERDVDPATFGPKDGYSEQELEMPR